MIKTETNLVSKHDTRYPGGPGSKQDECFYCNNKLGQPHNEACVCYEKTVIVDVTVRMMITAPAAFTAEDIEFHYNNHSCTENTWFMIRNYINEYGGCWCGHDKHQENLRITHVRDATTADDELFRERPAASLAGIDRETALIEAALGDT